MKTIELNLPHIPEEANTPLVATLLDNIEKLQTISLEQQETIRQIEDEIARLKRRSKKRVQAKQSGYR